MGDVVTTCHGAKCPTCHYSNDMPAECLRDHWQDLDCDRCGQALEYRGVQMPHTSWGYEIETRAVQMLDALYLPMKAVYFDQIMAGKKREEYRLATEFWAKRLVGKRYRRIVLTRGYPKGGGIPDVTRMSIVWNGMTRKTITHPHFGDAPVEVFAIDVRERQQP